MADDIEIIRRLVDESRSLPVKPAGWSMAALNPLAYEPKSPGRYEEDQRAAYVLDRINEQFPRAHIREGIPEGLRDAAYEHKRDPAYLKSPYETKGGSYSWSKDYGIPEVAMSTLRWAQSLPTAIYNTGQMVGNEVHKALSDDYADKHVPYPEAYDQFAYNMNTLTGGLTSNDRARVAGVPTAFGNLPSDLSYWKDLENIKALQDRTAEGTSRALWPPSAAEDLRMRIANEGQMQAQEMMPDGQEFLQSSGVPEQYAQWLGPAMDSFIGVPPTIGSAIKLSNAGKPMAALAELASDYALSTPNLWGPPLVQAAKNYSQGKSPWASSTKSAGR